MNHSGYVGELGGNIKAAILTRLKSLCHGSKGGIFNNHFFPDFKKLLTRPTIFELQSLADDDDKAFFIGVILAFLSQYRQHEFENDIREARGQAPLKHLLVLEEAHRLLRNVPQERTHEMIGNPAGKAVEFFCNALSEMRGYGQGLIVVEQIPSKLAPDVVKNTSSKIVHRIASRDDQELLASGIGLRNGEEHWINMLGKGYALAFKTGMNQPAEIKVNEAGDNIKISLEALKGYMEKTYSIREKLGARGIELFARYQPKSTELAWRFFNSLMVIEPGKLEYLWAAFQNSFSELNKGTYSQTILPNELEEGLMIELMKSLSKGVYCSGQLPTGTWKLLEETIQRKIPDRLRQLQAHFGKYSNKGSARDWILEIILNLALKKALSGECTHKIKPDRKWFSGFFIEDDDSVIEDLITRANRFFSE